MCGGHLRRHPHGVPKKSAPSATLARFAPLPVSVQELAASRFPALRTALASNSRLAPAVWESLYSATCPAALAEHLLWRKDLSPEQVTFALSTRTESRKAPVAALLAATPKGTIPEASLLGLCRPGMSSQLADLLVASNRVPRQVQEAAAPHASFKVGILWALRDHREVSDRTLTAILEGAPANKQFRWSVLAGLLLDRPSLRSRLLAARLNPTTAWMLASTSLLPAQQRPFLEAVEALEGRNASWRAGIIASVHLHPATTRETVEWVEGRAATSPLYARAVAAGADSGGPLSWGQRPSRLVSRRRIELLLSEGHTLSAPLGGSLRAWHLAELALNPQLTASDRARLHELLSSRLFEGTLTNCVSSASRLASTGEGDLVPPTRWRIDTRAGAYETLYHRMGEPAGAAHAVDGWGADLRMGDLSWDPFAAAEAAGHIAERLGEDLTAWEVAFSLADDFQGTADEFAAACRAIVS